MNNPSIEIVAIGNEVLGGYTVNTNAAFISKLLAESGYSVLRHTVLPDEHAPLLQGLREALSRSQIVLCTGGLGSTCDDVTRRAAVELFHDELVFHPEIAAELEKRYGKVSTIVKDQATLPTKGTLLPNNVGTASGVLFQEGESNMILMPGVPHEMKTMFQNHVLPYLQKRFPVKQKRMSRWIHLCGLPESAVDPLLRKLQDRYPNIEFGIYPTMGTLTIALRTFGEAHTLEAPAKEILDQFSSYVFESDSGRLDEAVHHLLIAQKKTLSLAESCTGGAVAACLTRQAGASAYLLGSIVAYSNEVKMKLLGVPENVIREHGAVSGEVARLMVEGVIKATGSDYGAAVTGIAGPSGGTPQKPVGTVWGAVARRGEEPKVWTFCLPSSREAIIQLSVNSVLGKLYHLAMQR